MKWSVLWASLVAIFVAMPFAAVAQSQSGQPVASQTAQQPANQQLLKAEELDALVAPIALYPDTLLSQVLIASTYPLEVVQAARWTEQNKSLKADALKAAVDKQGWDDSVKSLAATPSVLTMMNEKLDWTQKLGDAVLAQQPDVMDAIQRLRSKAQANNKLSSTKEQKVTVKQEGAKQIIAIEPAVPDTVYVPYYDPNVVYGGWPYPSYPPYYFGYPGYIPGAVIGAGIAFGAGFALGRWTSGGNYWGGNINWNNNNININRPQVNPLGGGNWQHNPAHRQGVRYNNNNVQQRFGNNNLRNGSQGRNDFRGRGGNQVLQPGGGRGNQAGAARPSTRPSGGTKAGSKGGGTKTGAKGGGAKQAGKGGGGKAASRPSSKGAGAARGGGNAFSGGQSGRATRQQSARGHSSVGSRGASMSRGGGGMSRGGGGMSRGGGGARGGGGGRRSDIRLKHDIALIGHLDNGLGYYRFTYNGGDKAYVGVMAQEVQAVRPDAVVRGQDGYLRVYYDKLGLKFETYDQWVNSGGRIPYTAPGRH